MPHPRKVYEYFKWFLYVIHRKVKSKLSIGKRLIVKPTLPDNPDGKILIHLGCGEINSPEFINVDARPAAHIHYVCDVNDLSIFPDNYADMVYACHILEHIRHNNLKKILWEWRRVVKPGGILRLSVPDYEKIHDIYEASRDINVIQPILMGGQDYAENIHYSVFNLKYLSCLLTEVGFRSVREWDPEQVDYHNFEDWASKTIEWGGKKCRVSLNIEAIK